MKTLICLVLILVWPIEYAPPDAEPGVTVVRGDRPLNTEGPRLPVTEPHLAVDPKDASHLVAAAIVIKKSDLSVADCAAFVSFDGGSSWKRHDFSLVECADPWVAVGEDGTVLLTVLGRAAGEDRAGRPPEEVSLCEVNVGRPILAASLLSAGSAARSAALSDPVLAGASRLEVRE